MKALRVELANLATTRIIAEGRKAPRSDRKLTQL